MKLEPLLAASFFSSSCSYSNDLLCVSSPVWFLEYCNLANFYSTCSPWNRFSGKVTIISSMKRSSRLSLTAIDKAS